MIKTNDKVKITGDVPNKPFLKEMDGTVTSVYPGIGKVWATVLMADGKVHSIESKLLEITSKYPNSTEVIKSKPVYSPKGSFPGLPAPLPVYQKDTSRVFKDPDRPIHLFFHIACIGNYVDVTKEIVTCIVKSGLYDSCEKIHCSVIAENPDKSVEFLHSLQKISIEYESNSIEDVEYPALNLLQKYCSSNDCYVLYVHTKGVSTPEIQSSQNWRKRLLQKTVKEWKECVSLLMQGNDVSGCGLKDAYKDGQSNIPTHFSGNFWWSKSEHINRLTPISQIESQNIHLKSSDNHLQFLKWRVQCEFWICSREGIKISVNGDRNINYRHVNLFDKELGLYDNDESLFYKSLVPKIEVPKERIPIKFNQSVVYTKDPIRVLIILHLFHIEMLNEMMYYVSNLKDWDYDLIVTVCDKENFLAISDSIKVFEPRATVIFSENKGLDVMPFISIVQNIDVSSYDICFKLHTKKSKSSWRFDLINCILGSRERASQIISILCNSHFKVIGSKSWKSKSIRNNEDWFKKWCDLFGYKNTPEDYVSGTMFACTIDILKEIKSRHIDLQIFQEGYMPDSRAEHGFERLLGKIPSSLQGNTMFVENTNGSEKDLRRLIQFSNKFEKSHSIHFNEVFNDYKADVSIVITLHNYEEYIYQCLDSCIKSDFKGKLEIVIVNDASSDGSYTSVVDFMTNNTDIPIFLISQHKNIGLAASRNAGIDASSGDFIFILDADNYIDTKCISKHYEEITKNNSSACYGIIKCFGATTRTLSDRPFNYSQLLKGNYIDAMAMFRKTDILDIGKYSEWLLMYGYGWEDYELWLRMGYMNKNITFIPEILSYYRSHHESMINTTNELYAHKTQEILKELYQ